MSKGGDESEKLIAFNSRRQTGGGGGRESPVKMIRHVIGDAILIDYHRSLPLTKLPSSLVDGMRCRSDKTDKILWT